jgi:hypothetical protein
LWRPHGDPTVYKVIVSQGESLPGNNSSQFDTRPSSSASALQRYLAMKMIISSISIALCLALGVSTPALADRGHQRDVHRGYYAASPARHHGDHRGYGWAGAAALLAITGIAAGMAASNHYAPEPVYVAPAQSVYSAPAAGYWNYCGSAGQYYPYVNDCSEGWQLVPAR